MPNGKIQITGAKEKEAFEEKMKDIAQKAKEKEVAAQAASLGFPYLDLVGFPIGPETITSIPKEISAQLKAVCFLNTGEEVRVGAVDPQNAEVKEILFQIQERSHGAGGAIYMISERSFAAAFKLYEALPVIKKIVKGVTIPEADLQKFQKEVKSFKDLQTRVTGVPVTEVVTLLIASGMNSDASDIHVEAGESGIVVRFRLDGVLNVVATLPADLWPKVISRIKLLSALKLNITDRPQDGRFTIFLTNDKIDVRVSTIPTAYGESVVMRLLRGKVSAAKFENLGLRGRAFEILAKEIERPNGMIITTGPTGSGKTTTLYGILLKLNSPETKIITLEDPVEYKLEGINQSQIDHSKEYTFAKGLRSILRQDPDVIMVGEMRDLETSETAIQAALTGHLVLSTIHTNSASGAVPRFLSMGVKPFLLAPALNAVIGQRLVRKICQECKIEDKLASETMERVKELLGAISEKSGEKVDLKKLKFWKGSGCQMCGNLGFKGRVGIYEIMQMTKEIEKVILSGEISEYKMQELAVENGMVTMVQDGLLKALDGITSVDEVFRTAE